jgi:pyrroline-5-carboxylate reductase
MIKEDLRIAILGGGNLGLAIAEGLLRKALVAPRNLCITKRNTASLSALAGRGVIVSADNESAVRNADVVFLALQPAQAGDVLRQIAPALSSSPILISVVTGFSSARIREFVSEDVPVYLAMPNTAILIGESMTCVATPNGSAEQTAQVLTLFNALGRSLLIREENMDSATILGACGIAYALRYIRAASQGGIEIGFHSEEALMIVANTVKGAAELLLQGHKHPESEIDKVTTPRGCTIAGLNEMEHQGFSSALIKGIITSRNKVTAIAAREA